MMMHYKQWLGACSLIVLGLFMANSNYAQVGNTCDTPLEIAALPFDHAGNMSDYGNNYSANDVPGIAPGAVTTGEETISYLNGDDVIYSYTPTENGVINIATTNSDDWIGLWVFTGCPFGATVGYHVQNGGTTRAIEGLNVMANTTYYIVVSNWPPVYTELNYTIHVEEGVPDCPVLGLNIGGSCDDGTPGTVNETVDENCNCIGIPEAPNNQACTATVLECGDDIQQSLIGAGSSMLDDCLGAGWADVWFTFTSDGSQIYTVSENTSFDAIVQLFVGDDCENLAEAADCKDSPENYSITEAGTYYFRLRPYKSSGNEGTIGVNLECVPFDCPELLVNFGDPCDDGNPGTVEDAIDENCDCVGIHVTTNDEACTATVLECGDDIRQSLIGATASLTDDCSGSGSPDVWFTFVSDGSEHYTVSENTSFDAIVQLFVGDDCENLTEVGACADLDEYYNISEAGTYYFRVRPWSSSNDEGIIGVALECAPYDCPELLANIGDPCDDGDPNTTNDVLVENCECLGSLPNQCINDSRYPSAVFHANGSLQTITTCAWRQEYTEIGNIEAGKDYEFTATPLDTWITVRTGTVGGAVVATGYSPLTITAPNANNLFVHWNTDDACGTAMGCIVTTVQCLTCADAYHCPELLANIGDACDDGDPDTTGDVITEDCECVGTLPEPCLNDARHPSAVFHAHGGLQTIETCTWRMEYSEIGSIEAGEDYEFTATPPDTWITVRTGEVGGVVVAMGYSPLTITAPNADNLFVHWNTDDACGTATGCIVTTVQCLTCANVYHCPELEANIGDACDDGDPDTVHDSIDENCDCMGIPAGTNDEACTATVLECGDELTHSLIGATASLTDDCSGTGTIDVWFTFVSDGSEIYTVSENTFFDAIVQLFVGDDCENLTEAGACSDYTEEYTITEAGTYYFRVRPFFAGNSEENIGVALECTPFDCPELEANIGEACDDGDPNTTNTEVNEDCECVEALPDPCLNNFRFPSGVFHANGTLQTIATCSWQQEYTEIGSVEAGKDYAFTATPLTTWITVRTGAVGGPVVATGYSPLTITAPNADNLFVHWNTDDQCGTAMDCITTTVQCVTCADAYECPELLANIGDACDDGDPYTIEDVVNEDCECAGTIIDPCLNDVRYPANVINAGVGLQTIAPCSWQQDYSEIGNIEAGEDYEFTATTHTTWITVRTGEVGGPVVGMGYSPLTITAPNADNLFVHWNSDEECGTLLSCITTTVQCLTCSIVFDCPELEANFGDSCDDGDPNTTDDVITEDCECAGIPIPDNDNCEGAIALECGEPVSGTTVNVSASGLSATCDGFTSISALDVFYTFEADGVSSYTVTATPSASQDLVLFVYSGACGELVEVGCSDSGNPESVALDTPEAGTYYVRVFRYIGTANFTVDVNCTPPPFDCPELEANIGDACDDGDASTENDTVNANCECVGTLICADPQPAVEGLWQEYVEGEGILFHWDAVPNSIGCQFRLYTADMTLIQKTSIYGFEMDQLLAPEYIFDYATDYIFGIRCGCSDDPITVGPWSSLEFTTPGAANMVSSPNPTSGISNVEFEVAVEEHVTLEVYDMSGRSLKVLYQGQAVPTDAYRFQFDGSGLPAGVYIYRLTTESEVMIEKFMIAK